MKRMDSKTSILKNKGHIPNTDITNQENDSGEHFPPPASTSISIKQKLQTYTPDGKPPQTSTQVHISWGSENKQ